MVIGLVAENVAGDSVTLLSPDAVKEVIDRTGLEFLVESGVGRVSGFDDEDYARAGGRVVRKEEAYRAEVIVRRSAPSKEELALMDDGSLVVSMLHPDGCPEKVRNYEDAGVGGIALDMLLDDRGRRSVYLADITAQNGLDYGYSLLGSDPADVSVVIMGYGNLGKEAVEHASRKRSDVRVLNKRHFQDISSHIGDVDMLVNAINWPFHLRGKERIMTREDLRYMKPGSVLVDLVVNPPGMSPIETSTPTYQDNLHYTTDGIVHACCWGWPGLTPERTCLAYSKIMPGIITDFVNGGLEGRPANTTRAYVNTAAFRGVGR